MPTLKHIAPHKIELLAVMKSKVSTCQLDTERVLRKAWRGARNLEPLVAAGPKKGGRKTDPKMGPHVGVNLEAGAKKTDPFFHPGRPSFHFWAAPDPGLAPASGSASCTPKCLEAGRSCTSTWRRLQSKEHQDVGKGSASRMSLLIAAHGTLFRTTCHAQ